MWRGTGTSEETHHLQNAQKEMGRLHDMEFGKDFLDTTPKQGQNQDELDVSKMKTFGQQRTRPE